MLIDLFSFSHTSPCKIESSLSLLTACKMDPTSLPMWDKHCYIQDDLHATVTIFKVSTSNVPNYQVSDFFICDIGMCNSNSKLQMSIAPLFVNKNTKCGYAFS